MNGDLDENLSVSALNLQLRALTQKDISFFFAYKDKFLKKITEPETYGKLIDNQETYNSEDFTNLLGLLSHKEDGIIVVIWNLTLSFFLLKCLAFTQWLPHHPLAPS